MPSRRSLAAAFAAIYLFWGTTFLALRYAVAEVPPLLTIAIRCGAGAFIIFGWLAARGRLEPFTRQQWFVAGGAGLLLFLGGHSILAWAEMEVPSGQAALLLTAIPSWLVLLEAIRLRRMPPGRVLAGLIVGTVGVALLAGGGSGAGSLERGALVLAALLWAAGSLFARHSARPASAAQATAMQLAAGGVIVLLASVGTGELARWDAGATSARAAGSIVFLVLGGTVAGFGAYTWLLRVTSAAAVGTYAFVNPIIAVLLAWAVGDESPSVLTGVAALLVLSAVFLISLRVPAGRLLPGSFLRSGKRKLLIPARSRLVPDPGTDCT